MNARLPTRRRVALLAALLLAVTGISGMAASDSTAGGCAAQFEEAQRIDMESFRDYDAEAFRDGHHADAVTVFASGHVFIGIDAIMAALAGHFEDREAIWTWTETYRVVDGCKSAFILYETTYAIPSAGFSQHALTGVTYTHQGDRWLSIADQGTLLP